MITNAEEFVRLRSSSNPNEYRRAAHEPAPETVWHDIITQYPEMWSWVAHNKTMPIAILERLSSASDPHVRTMVAMKRKLPEPLQIRLAHDPDSGVRNQLACNVKVTRIVLQILAADSELFIREKAQHRLATEPYP
ncbi:HEAT repeat domain-containing protein [Candidatus Gracilibacteria bacterium]|nr:HEAT repeat domain-containing protein [Candidatus Gracilibacteria bacterium]